MFDTFNLFLIIELNRLRMKYQRKMGGKRIRVNSVRNVKLKLCGDGDRIVIRTSHMRKSTYILTHSLAHTLTLSHTERLTSTLSRTLSRTFTLIHLFYHSHI